jgi:hypothetical protein
MIGHQRIGLTVLAILFLAWHVPLVYRTEAGQDEDWYGVPGITILRTGLPQIPYIPSRDPGSACYKADVILYALPPLAFYLQALVHLILGVGMGPARMTAVFAGLFSCALLYDLTCLWFGDRRAALIAAAAYLVARAFYFPATTARPDMVAVAMGLLAVDAAVRHRRGATRRTLTVAGVAAGLSLLAHPFGVVPATQVGLALLAGPGHPWTRLRHLVWFSTIALLCFSLWLLLILLHPEIFRVQFGSNVLGRAGPGLGGALLAPWSVLGFQLRQILVHLQPLQAILYALALAGGTRTGWNKNYPDTRDFVYHLWASWLLLIFFEGKHPTLGYYAYPAVFSSIALGILASRAMARVERTFERGPFLHRTALPWVLPIVLLLVFLPGAGLRTLVANLRHLNDPAYDAHTLAQTIMSDIPPAALTAVDGAYVLDFYLADRPVLEATIHRLSYDFRARPFEYVVFARDGLRRFLPMMTGLTLVRSYGDRTDLFAPYAELYRRMPAGSGLGPGTKTSTIHPRRSDRTEPDQPTRSLPLQETPP